MLVCTKCGNETRTANLLTSIGQVMVSGPAGTDPLPLSAQVCVACGHVDLYAPQSFELPDQTPQEEAAPVPLLDPVADGETTVKPKI